MRFRIEVDGAQVLDRSFNRITDKISDFRDIWPEVQKTFLEIESDQFASGGAKGASGDWEDLAPSTIEKKGFMGSFKLIESGDLKASVSRKGAKGQIYDPQPLELTLGTSIPYAIYHQRGTKRMPARPVIDLSEESKRKIQKSIQKGLVDFVRKAGFVETEFNEVG